MDSRYIRIIKTPIQKRKRVRKIHGAFEDNGKYFYCWNCGAICSVERNATATGYGAQGMDFSEPGQSMQASYNDLGIGFLPYINIDWGPPYDMGVMVRLGPDGVTPMGTYTDRTVEVSKGCWFCGATNIYGGQSN
jgi:hypothetical protein